MGWGEVGVGVRGVGGEGGGRGWKVITVRNDTKAAVTIVYCSV